MLYDVLKLYLGKFQLHTPVTPIQTSWAQRTVSDFTPKVGGENAAQYLPQCKIDYSCATLYTVVDVLSNTILLLVIHLILI